MFSVPLLSIALSAGLKTYSPALASIGAEFAYFLHTPLIFW